ncbi:hypothetical protein OG229_02155 [Streptomyces platensis]|uniref:hypothetical protein n=1 Tax=Streptomyces platensis TaxID=58346 RepID=UPI002E13B0F8|nr:hypothetical protein OG229_02155 [Streptomyces platensis]
MTTAAPTSVEWIRITIGGCEFTIEPLPGIDLCLTLEMVELDGGFHAPLTRGLDVEHRISVALAPSTPEAIFQCEGQARDILNRLGAKSATTREFSLEAALGGEGLPGNRVSAPRLLLTPGDPVFEELPVPSVPVFTAKIPRGCRTVYTLTSVQS